LHIVMEDRWRQLALAPTMFPPRFGATLGSWVLGRIIC
jgi:hypothetical protein